MNMAIFRPCWVPNFLGFRSLPMGSDRVARRGTGTSPGPTGTPAWGTSSSRACWVTGLSRGVRRVAPLGDSPCSVCLGKAKLAIFCVGAQKKDKPIWTPQNGRAFAVVPVPKPNQTGSTNLRTTPQMLKCGFLGFPLDRPQKQDGLTKAQTPCQFEQLLWTPQMKSKLFPARKASGQFVLGQ